MRVRLKTAGPILLFCIAVLATEQAVPVLYTHLPVNLQEWDRVAKRKVTIGKPEDVDVLILGDSTGAQGLIPQIFEDETGLRTENLATYGDRSATADDYFLRTYLDNHTPPKDVIMIRSVKSWNTGFTPENMRAQFPRIDLATDMLRWDFLPLGTYMRILTEKIFPSLLYREKTAFARTVLTDESVARHNRYNYVAGLGRDGYEPFDPNAHAVNIERSEQNLQPFREMRLPDGTLDIAPYNVPLLRDVCTRATANGGRFFLSLGLSSSVVVDDPEIRETMTQLMAVLGDALADNPNCTLLPMSNIADEYLSDLTHTNDLGAQVFTAFIAQEFLKALKNPVIPSR